jgi:hypothetical protein
MKKMFTLAALTLVALTALAETVNLKITYKGDGISGHTVYVMIGGGVLGSGVTDSNGEVSISVSSLPTKHIDLKGEKKCEGAQKSWEVKGYVTLDGSNFGHLKMEEPIAEMVEASGGFMSESMMVSSYGLVCAGSSGSSSGSSKSDEGSSLFGSDSGDSDEGSSSSSTTAEAPPLMTKEEALAQQKLSLENKIYTLESKMNKKQGKIDSGKFTGDKATDAEWDIKEMEVEKKIAENKLAKVNMQIDKGLLNKAEKNQFKTTEKSLKEELKGIKEERKGGKAADATEAVAPSDAGSSEEAATEVAAEEETEDLNFTEEKMNDMSMGQLKKKKLSLNSKLKSLKVKLKTKKKFMSPNEVTEAEAKVAALEEAIATLEAEIAKREGE